MASLAQSTCEDPHIKAGIISHGDVQKYFKLSFFISELRTEMLTAASRELGVELCGVPGV